VTTCLYTSIPAAHEDARHPIDLRWRAARERLAARGADPATLDAVGEALTDPGRTAPGTIVAGDVRARALLLEHLDPSLRQVTAVVEDEVPADSEAVAAASGRIIAARIEQAARERFGQWQEQLSRAAAVEGLAGTVTALGEGRVADIFISSRFSGELLGDLNDDGPGSAPA